MDKKKIVVTGLYFGITAMLEYVVRALKRRTDIEVLTVGVAWGTEMPWGAVTILPDNYAFTPDIALPQMSIGSSVPIEYLESRLPSGFVPDLWLNIDAGFHPIGKPKNGINVVYYTDAHVLQDWYNQVRPNYDFIFNSHSGYMKGNEILLPYAFDSEWHIPLTDDKIYDTLIIGNHYQTRVNLVNELNRRGRSAVLKLGIGKDDVAKWYAKAKIGINWSSLADICARVFELMGMECVPLINRIPALNDIFKEDEHYIGFAGQDEAISKVEYILNNYEWAKQIAKNGRELMITGKHSWDDRMETLLKTTGVI